MNENCRDIVRIVWSDGPDAASQEHLAECDSCREESRRAGDLQAALSGMRVRYAVPPSGLDALILDALRRSRFDRARDAVGHPKFWRGAAVGAAAAATAAVGVVVARRLVGRPEPELVG